MLDCGGCKLQSVISPNSAAHDLVVRDKKAGLPGRVYAGSRGGLIALSNQIVLHKKLVGRGTAMLLLVMLATIGVQSQGGIKSSAVHAKNGVWNLSAIAGFKIDEITLSGQAVTGDAALFVALAVEPGLSLFSYNVEKARVRLLALPAVKDVSIRKFYPRTLEVRVSEYKPFARWQIDGHSVLVDINGRNLGVPSPDYDVALPLIMGVGADQYAMLLHSYLDEYQALKIDLAAVERIGSRRWDLVYKSGLRVRLPADGEVLALARLAQLQISKQILDRDIALVDMRIDGQISVRPTERAQEIMVQNKRDKKEAN